ncbi:PhnD/SsuA/transferrin family substrate-binding protein [Hydrogenophaga sp. PAMC20947]|uniref:phosphate/phosphite/phosphonate ABC transporter substrate-binding protein n=1 Tax=Hydrogenophaga sp. PAMC20947 TaxID=2565558 RepID=UPI00109DE8E5|nr:PhnD/SsuA/transferrin family substrate-binding protein [Hydrogenophaga sp. PAMC20947]QCB45760.1 phosphate ABC transporter substrate-binding protein [Hydrogenophaga sp. PAMC20947]
MRQFFTPLAISLALVLSALAPSASARDLILAISEGSSGGTDHARVISKYQGLADVIGRSINKNVAVIFIREFSALEDGLTQKRFDLAMARPSDYPARAIRDHGYQYVASGKPDGQCFIIVPKRSTLTSLSQIKGKRMVMPNPAAYMTKLCTAELKRQGIDLEQEDVKRVKEQGAVAFFLENSFADVGGVASYSGVAKSWEAKGHRVLHKSEPQPYFPLIASNALSTAEVAAIQQSLRKLPDSPAGQKVLDTIELQAFDTGSEQRLAKLLLWLGL